MFRKMIHSCGSTSNVSETTTSTYFSCAIAAMDNNKTNGIQTSFFILAVWRKISQPAIQILFAALELLCKFKPIKSCTKMRIITAVLLCLLSFFSFSQDHQSDFLKSLKPRSIGSAGMSGRITAIDGVIKNPDSWYVGVASGGGW